MRPDLRRLSDALAALHATAAVVAVGVLAVVAPRVATTSGTPTSAAGLVLGMAVVAALYVAGCVAAVRAAHPVARTAAAAASGTWSLLLARAVFSDTDGLAAATAAWALVSLAWVAVAVAVHLREVRTTSRFTPSSAGV